MVDPDGATHVRVDQRYKGLPVIGGTATIHTDAQGNEDITDALVKDLDLDITPRLSAAQALAAAGASATDSIELAIAVDKKRVRTTPRRDGDLRDNALDYQRVVTGAHLVYRIHTHAEHPRRQLVTLVDATTSQRDEGGDLTNTAKTAYSNTHAITTGGIPNLFFLEDPTRGNFSVYDMGSDDDGTLVDVDGVWGDGQKFVPFVTSRQTAAADAFLGIEVVWDMYKRVFHWNGLDNEGTAPTVGVHDADSPNNSHYSDDEITIGDAVTTTGGTMATLDVMGHEFSHGVDHYSAGLGGDEGDGLNEGNSDIFGTLSRIYFDDHAFDAGSSAIPATSISEINNLWIFGSDMQKGAGTGGVRRSMFDPHFRYYFDHIGDENGHSSCGPIDRAFFFLAMGSSSDVTSPTWSHSLPWGMTGIGNDAAAHVWFNTLTRFLQSDDGYAEARAAAISGVRSLFTMNGPQEKAVRNAFAGIDVGSPAVNAPTDPGSAVVPPGHDSESNAFFATIPGGSPVDGLRKLDLVAVGNPGKDDIQLFVPCGESLGARLESPNNYTLDAFDGGTHLVSGASQNVDLVMTVPATACPSAPRTIFIRVLFTSLGDGLVPSYVLHLDAHN